MSTIDSQEIFKPGRTAFSSAHREIFLWWVLSFIGVLIAATGLISYLKDLPPLILHSESWMVVGGILFTVSGLALLDRFGVIRIWSSRRSRTLQVRLRIETYYRRGHDLYQRIDSDPSISPEDVRQIVATEWVNPVTEYLRGTVGNRQALEFLCISEAAEPDQSSVKKLGYSKALARVRILDRLERLRTALLDLR